MRFPSTLFVGCGALALMLVLACGGSSTSSTTPPAISTAPANATVKSGASASFTVAASGNPAPTIAWERSGDAGSTWTAISGATSATYTFPTALADDAAQFRAKATNSLGSVTSAAASAAGHQAASIALSGSDLYFLGNVFAAGTAPSVWKNGTCTSLEQPAGNTGFSKPSYITLFDSIVYIAGECGNIQGYWKNGAWVALPVLNAAAKYNYAMQVSVCRGDIYVGGYCLDASKLPVAGYLKNGVWSAMALPAGFSGTCAYGVTLQ